MSSSPEPPEKGLLFVVSAPSGTGKTTIVDRLVRLAPALERSRSYTSRAIRPGEKDGVDYNFVSRTAFETMVREDAFLEWADVFGNLYGTGRTETDRRLAAGADLVLVIDVQGARQVRSRRTDSVGIFVLPPSLAVLEARLRGRSKDPEPEIRRRLATAREEVSAASDYDYVVVNDELDRCVTETAAIVAAERARLGRRRGLVAEVARTFE
jgi:guanylate kinase